MKNSKKLKIASFNTKCLLYSKQKNEIANVIKTINADIIGLQEIDCYTERSGQYNQMEFLSKECGYPFYSFTPSIDYQGGKYGHGILSKYPIIESNSCYYFQKSKKDHNRNYSLNLIDIDKTIIAFFNTHLTLGKPCENGAEILQVTEKMANFQYSILTGDMNTEPINFKKYINFNKIKVLNGSESLKNCVKTFPQGEKSKSAIDNILISNNISAFTKARGIDSVDVFKTEFSDHNPIYTYITI